MKKISFVLTLLFVCAFGFSFGQAGEMRTWTSGDQTVKGEFVELTDNGTVVQIRKKSGKMTHVKLKKLSPEDQEYIKNLQNPAEEEREETVAEVKEPVSPTPLSSFDIEGTKLLRFTGPEKDVVIPDSVKQIRCRAFMECRDLTSVKIPQGVTVIEGGAFQDCSSLTSVELPEGLTEIGGGAFQNCSSLTHVKIPEGVTVISDMAFCGCSSLTSVELPEGLTEICFRAFKDCSSLTSVVIPKGVTRIGWFAFMGCSSLKSVEIPKGMKVIDLCAFEDCSSLKFVKIPEKTTVIERDAFKNCPKVLIIAPKGSKAEEYVRKEGIPWRAR